MISDTLSKAIHEIHGHYLKWPPSYGYTGPTRKRIEKLVELMDMVRAALDCPPTYPWSEECAAAFDAAVNITKASKRVRKALAEWREEIVREHPYVLPEAPADEAVTPS